LNLSVSQVIIVGDAERGGKDTPITKLYLALWTFAGIMTVSTFVSTFVACFAGRDGSA
jgi:hypothetical protein